MEVEQVMYILMVRDMDRAVDFYTGVIGFRGRSVTPRWSELAFGDFTLALHIDDGDGGERKSIGLSFTVRDLDSVCREVEAAGGKVINAPHDGDIEGLSPNPPKDTDGGREDSGRGWVRE